MALAIGLDIGGSTTKVVGLDHGEIQGSWLGKADDAEASAYGALFKYISEHGISVDQIKCLMVTGVGQGAVNRQIVQAPVRTVDEFEAVGAGGLYLTGLDEAIVVSMGTGTAIVHATKEHATHLIGSGVGGGTLLGLARVLAGTRDFAEIEALARDGERSAVDLSVADISINPITGLHGEITASNFGKVQNQSSEANLMAGLVNMIYQTVGIMATLCARKRNLLDVVWVGQASELDSGRQVLREVAQLYGMRFHCPDMAPFATACGAALLGGHGLTEERA